MTIQNFDTWSITTSGFKYIPHSIAAQAASIGVGLVMNLFNLGTIKNIFLPPSCGLMDQLPLSSKVRQIIATYGFFVGGAVTEELQIRGIFQDGLLTKTPRMFFKNNDGWVDSTFTKILRTVISASIFSWTHRENQQTMGLTDEQMNFQYVNTFGLGLATAAIKEKTGSIWPAISLHAAYNIIAPSITFLHCLIKSNHQEEPLSSLKLSLKNSKPTIANGVCPRTDPIVKMTRPLFQCWKGNELFFEKGEQLSRMAADDRQWAKNIEESAAQHEAEAALFFEKAETYYPD